MPLEPFDKEKCSCSQYECDYCRDRWSQRRQEAFARTLKRRNREREKA